VRAPGSRGSGRFFPAVDVAQLRRKADGPAGITLALLGFYIALHTSYAGEIMMIYLHIPFPVVGLFSVIVPLVIFFAGKMPRFLETPVARPWLMLYVWMALCSVLSFYPRESVGYVIPFGLRIQIMPFLFCAIATTSKAVRGLVAWGALGLIPILILCITNGEMQEGYRFGIADTSLQNPNDLAFHLLWGSMLLLVFVLGKGKPGRILAILAIPTFVWFILKTASRGNFLTFFAVLAVAFLLSTPSRRMIVLLVVPVGLGIALPLLPKATLDRILAIEVNSIEAVGQQADATADNRQKWALGSEAARMELAKLAVDATLRHPFFGVGISMFADETADFVRKATGGKAPWQTAHNSYLKISSENGIPGFIFYVWSIVASIWMTWSTFNRSRRRPGFEDANRNSLCILLALVVYAVSTLFCDIVYQPYLSITVGLAAANFLAFRNEDRLAAALARVPQRSPLFGAAGGS
jgi:O-antigen ligase